MEWPPWCFGFMPLPSVALRSGASEVCTELFWKPSGMLRLVKLMTNFEGGPIEVGAISLDPLVSLN